MPLDQFSERVPNEGAFFLNDTATVLGFSQFYYPSSSAGRIDAMTLQNTDTVDHYVTIKEGTNTDPAGWRGTVKVPAGAGNGTVPIVDVLANLMPSTQPFFMTFGGTGWYFAVNEAISSGKFVIVAYQGGDF